jgi:uncharacterized membrane protein YeaQ/YmgE (transglycosylase-associated protein family)
LSFVCHDRLLLLPKQDSRYGVRGDFEDKFPVGGPSGTSPALERCSINNFEERAMGIIWTIIIGFVAGIIAKFIMPGSNEPSGFIMTTILGIVGAFVASYLGQALGWYAPGEGAGLIGAIIGAIIVLFVWGMIAGRRRA